MMTSVENAIEIKNFHKRYNGVHAVQGLDLVIRAGTFFGFVGPNGAGKSTTINAMVGMIQPSSGTISICGFDIMKEPLKVKANVGFMPEETVLFERLTAREYMSFVGTMYGLTSEKIKARTIDLLTLLELDGDKFMGTYSLGMKKKAALAVALIHEPPVLILDEPFSGIDTGTASRIRAALLKMVEDGHTVFFSSHVLEMVERISGEIGILNKGRLLASGTMESVRKQAGCDPNASLEDAFLKLVGASDAC
jgi:ABC-2 type transport system ATP-binding protein